MKAVSYDPRRIINRSGRAKLPARRDPYWHLIADGQHLGYRKGAHGGTWIARFYVPGGKRSFQSLGQADDTVDPDGQQVLSFAQAIEAANEFMAKSARAASVGIRIGKFTVSDACNEWLKSQTSPTSKIHVENDIRPTLGKVPVDKLTKAKLQDWLLELGQKPTVRSLSPNSKVPFDINDPETRRKRQDTANRVLRSLRAVLNLAYSNGKIANTAPWDTVREFDKVSKLRTEYLSVDEGKRFIAACEPDFRKLVQAALYTGCRYGELCSLQAGALDVANGFLSVLQAKTGTVKNIFLTPAEVAFFAEQAAGKRADEPMFLRTDGKPWAKDHQKLRMRAARQEAGIEQNITFHNLRHTFASLLAMGGVQRELIQAQMGHSSPRMTQRYTHFSPSYAAAAVRASKASFGRLTLVIDNEKSA